MRERERWKVELPGVCLKNGAEARSGAVGVYFITIPSRTVYDDVDLVSLPRWRFFSGSFGLMVTRGARWCGIAVGPAGGVDLRV